MPTAQRIAFLRGHEDSVVSLAVTRDSELLASGAEDGGLCIHHLPSFQLVSKLQLCSSGETAVGALAWHPKQQQLLGEPHGSTSSSSSSSSSAFGRLLFAGVGRELVVLRLAPGAGSFGSCAESAHTIHQQHTTPTAAPATDVPCANSRGSPSPPSSAGQVHCSGAHEHGVMQLHVLLRRPLSSDDLSSLSVNAQGTYLAAADDAGDILLLDMHKLQQQLQQQLQNPPSPPPQQQQHSGLPPCRTIASAHYPMATAVVFRGAHKPWQLLSGGVDHRVALWDFSRPKKCISSWNMQHMAGLHTHADSVNQSQVSSNSSSSSCNTASAGGPAEQHQPQLWNPPMVHGLAVPWSLPQPQQHDGPPVPISSLTLDDTPALSHPNAAALVPRDRGSNCLGSSSSSSKQEDSVMAGVAKGIVAVARGDGTIAVFDANPDAKPSTRQQQQQAQARAAAGAAAGDPCAVQQQHSVSKKSSSARTRQRGAPAKGGSHSSGLAPHQKHHQLQHGAQNSTPGHSQQSPGLQQQQQLGRVPPGFHVCLDQSHGGHSLPAACVCFMPWAAGCRYLWSAGQDHRLLLWDWTAALPVFAPAAPGSAGAAKYSCIAGDGGGAQGDTSWSAAAGDKSAAQPGLHKQPQSDAGLRSLASADAAGSEERQRGPQEVQAVAAAAAAAAHEIQPATGGCRANAGSDQVVTGSTCLLLEKQHQRKVNALCSCWEVPVGSDNAIHDGAAVLLIVADTASRMSVYRVKL